MVSRLLLVLAFLVTSVTAFAHESGQHVLGTVTAIDEKHIEIKTPKGAAVSVKLTKQTRFKAKGNPKATEPPAVGDRVVIEATKENKILTATEVHYSAAKHAPAATQ
jgi:hypothetical protein